MYEVSFPAITLWLSDRWLRRIAINADPNFKVLSAAHPYAAANLVDQYPAPELRESRICCQWR